MGHANEVQMVPITGLLLCKSGNALTQPEGESRVICSSPRLALLVLPFLGFRVVWTGCDLDVVSWRSHDFIFCGPRSRNVVTAVS